MIIIIIKYISNLEQVTPPLRRWGWSLLLSTSLPPPIVLEKTTTGRTHSVCKDKWV
jgi:hypothetical protein